VGLFGPPNVEKLEKKGKISALIAALAYTKNSEIPAAAARALGRLGDSTAVQPLVDLLEREEVTSVEPVVSALGRLADARAVGPLLSVLRSPATDDGVARAATLALVQIGDRDAILEAASNDSPMLRRRAVIAAGMLGDERALDAMADLFVTDPTDESRSAVLLALGGIGGPKAAATVTRLLADLGASDTDALSGRQLAALKDGGAFDLLLETAAGDSDLAGQASGVMERLRNLG